MSEILGVTTTTIRAYLREGRIFGQNVGGSWYVLAVDVSATREDKEDRILRERLMRILGLDFGEKRIGVAISDETGLLASALKAIENRGEETVLEELKGIISSFEVEEIVIGLPKMMDGSLAQEAAKVHSFVSYLRENLSCPISLWDERLSTVAAQNILIQGDLSRKKRKKAVDKLSAVIILQGYLEKKIHRVQGVKRGAPAKRVGLAGPTKWVALAAP